MPPVVPDSEILRGPLDRYDRLRISERRPRKADKLGNVNREERLAQNEILFREVNERIKELESGSWDSHEIGFMCECADATCMAVITLRPAEYEALRRNPRQFGVLPGHQIEDVESVVESHPDYLVVEKHLETVEQVEEADPRQ
jgi:hypothetical protein